ncbi:MAG: hypothetical protein AUH71_05525 [Thaumarchaeota archaeon 13_1_40CM_4_48_7]|nr:MAG: hypothetical protein AUH71_05525 [Thaumarchaeota archaeon 13_1_40CM_4_48_7]OLC92693.1 MAG: hypothetical protein AUI92_04630 [Thaumarchaeota archaeon 13_1_40CM_3_38_6]
MPIRETLDKVIPIAKSIGITRIADTTHMDRLRIPNYSSVLPGTEDIIWVYNGKGLTKEHALASVIMESIERYCSLPSSRNHRFIVGTYEELSKKYSVLHPDEVVEAFRFKYRSEMVLDFIQGTELFSNTPILVPAALALYRYGYSTASLSTGTSPATNDKSINPFLKTHTIGLASGNVLEEAVCHALCEVIEHDAVSIAELVGSAIPYTILRKMVDSLRANGYRIMEIPANVYVDDNSLFPDVDISGLDFSPINYLISRFEKSGVPLLLKDVTSDIGIPTFIATSFEWITHDYAFSAYGQGTHPDARVALIRAITEVAQTRTTNSQGSRDDLKKVKYEENNYDQNKRNWKFVESKERAKFSKINSHVNEDILDDINLLLSHIKKSGLKKAIIVDLTNPNIGVPVVRALVPGLENFDESKSVMGKRAKEHFRKLKRL